VTTSDEDCTPDEITDWFDQWSLAAALADDVRNSPRGTATESKGDEMERSGHSDHPTKYQEERLIEALRVAAAELGQPLSTESYDYWAQGHPDRPVYNTINNRLSWDEATDRAGIETPGGQTSPPGTDRRYSDSEIIEALQEAAKELGEPLRVAEYNQWRSEIPKPRYRVINRRFGGWKEAKDDAGIK